MCKSGGEGKHEIRSWWSLLLAILHHRPPSSLSGPARHRGHTNHLARLRKTTLVLPKPRVAAAHRPAQGNTELCHTPRPASELIYVHLQQGVADKIHTRVSLFSFSCVHLSQWGRETEETEGSTCGAQRTRKEVVVILGGFRVPGDESIWVADSSSTLRTHLARLIHLMFTKRVMLFCQDWEDVRR